MKIDWKPAIAGVTALSLLAGCGSAAKEPQAEEPQKAKASKAETIVVWVDEGEKEGLESSTEIFEGKNGVEVVLEEVPKGKHLSTLIKEHDFQMPDVIELDREDIGVAASEGIIQDIQLEKKAEQRFYASALDSLRYKGALYGIPKSASPYVFVYNPDLFGEQPKDFQDVYKRSLALKEKGLVGFYFPWAKFDYTSMFFHSFGAAIFEQKDGVYNTDHLFLNGEEAVEAAEYMMKWKEEGLFPEESESVSAMLETETLASSFMPYKSYVKIKEKNAKLIAVPLPPLEEGKASHAFIDTEGYAVTKHAKNKTLAVELIEQFVSLENAKFRLETTGELTPIKALAKEKAIAEQKDWNTILHGVEQGIAIPNVGEMQEVNPAMNVALKLMMDGTLPVKEALDYAVEDISFAVEANHRK